MVITNNYRTCGVVGEKWKKRACAVDGRARAARRTSCLSRLSGVSRVCRRQGVVGFDFHSTSSSPGKASSKGTRDTCRRESHGAHGATDDAARCVGGLTAIRSASTKATACPAALQYFNHEFGSSPTRDGRAKRDELGSYVRGVITFLVIGQLKSVE